MRPTLTARRHRLRGRRRGDLADEHDARAAATAVFAGTVRQRPFHWHREGSTVRRAIIDALGEIGAVARVCVTIRPAASSLMPRAPGALTWATTRVGLEG